MRKMPFALVAAAFLFAAGAAQAGSLITAQELASRLGMTCNADPTGSRCTLSDGVNEGIFRADLDIEAAANMIVALLRGAVITTLMKFDFEKAFKEIEIWLTNK